jgi:hypothetical protein
MNGIGLTVSDVPPKTMTREQKLEKARRALASFKAGCQRCDKRKGVEAVMNGLGMERAVDMNGNEYWE